MIAKVYSSIKLEPLKIGRTVSSEVIGENFLISKSPRETSDPKGGSAETGERRVVVERSVNRKLQHRTHPGEFSDLEILRKRSRGTNSGCFSNEQPVNIAI